MYFTPKELAQRFKVTERAITQWARMGILPAIRIGRLWRFKVSAIEEWERAQGVDRDEIEAFVMEIEEGVKKGGR